METSKKCYRLSLTQDSIPVTLLAETSIHGVKYIAQENRHWTERLFWLAAFLLGVLSSVYLIHGLWDRYQKTPVIVTLDVNEQHIKSIPFPAVTICNVNVVSRRLVKALEKILEETSSSDAKQHEAAKRKLGFVRHLCQMQPGFAKQTGYDYGRPEGSSSAETSSSSQDQVRFEDLLVFLAENTAAACGEMLRICTFGGTISECSKLFKPTISSYGKCCTFNMLPLSLLFKNVNVSMHNNDSLSRMFATQGWDESGELDWWAKSDSQNSILAPPGTPQNIRPWKQTRKGLSYGLSILMDPNLDDSYCPAADSNGARLALHSPLESPRVVDVSSAVQLGKEILVEVNADITKADPDIRGYPQEKRGCYFGAEKQLKFYRPYTITSSLYTYYILSSTNMKSQSSSFGDNCIEECFADHFATECGCMMIQLPSYDPEHRSKRLCSFENYTGDLECFLNAHWKQEAILEETCKCYPLCEEIKYSHQMSVATLRTGLWEQSPDQPIANWQNNSMAIIHIFFGSDRTVPKLRKALYGMADLIANTGGILGLCLGFSVLSGVELIYFVTLRTFWKRFRQRRSCEETEEVAASFVGSGAIRRTSLFRAKSKVIRLNKPEPDADVVIRRNVGWM